MKKLFVVLFLLCGISVCAQIRVNDREQDSSDFPLCVGGKACDIYIDSSDFEVVKKSVFTLCRRCGASDRTPE